MRKHPLLAFVTAIISCSIPGTVTAAWANTTSATPTTLGTDTVFAPPAATSSARPHRHKARHHRAKGAKVVHRKPATKVRHHVKARIRPAAIHPYIALGGVWASLRSCESRNDYAANTGNGYYGAYQFSRSSWVTVGEAGLPSAASPEIQDAAARALFSRQGWRAWPACSWKIGLA